MRYRELVLEAEHPALPEVTDALIREILAEPGMANLEKPEGLEDPDEPFEVWLRFAVHGVMDEIAQGIDNNTLTVYRGIEIADLAALNVKNLGVYWTTTAAMAFPYNAGGSAAPWLVLQGRVALQHVNWVSTIALHLRGGEDEVGLNDHVPIKIINAWWQSHNASTRKQSLRRMIGRVLFT